jgi:hypothetical protein
LTLLQNSTREVRAKIAKDVLTELKAVRSYGNKSLLEKGNQMGMVVPQITSNWRWSWMRKADMKTSLEEDIPAPPVPIPAAPPHNPIVAAPPPPSPPLDPQEPLVLVDIEGEMVEMTPQQANEVVLNRV